jgi:hypothetical protein
MLTLRGNEIGRMVELLADWIETNLPQVMAAQEKTVRNRGSVPNCSSNEEAEI